MKLAILSVEGVLAHQDDIRQVPATKWAKPLYDGLRVNYNTMLLSRADPEIASWWLKRERFAGYSLLRCWEPASSVFTYGRWRIDQVQGMLADGFEVGCYVDTDTVVLERIRDLGVLTLGVSYPDKAVGWRDPEDTAPRPWAQVASTVEDGQEVEHGTG